MKSMRISRRGSRYGRSFLLTCIVFLLGFIVGNVSLRHPSSAQGRVALSDTDLAFEPFWDAFSIVEERYVDPIEVDILVNGAIDGLVNALEDDHSGYIRPDLCDMSHRLLWRVFRYRCHHLNH